MLTSTYADLYSFNEWIGDVSYIRKFFLIKFFGEQVLDKAKIKEMQPAVWKEEPVFKGSTKMIWVKEKEDELVEIVTEGLKKI